MLLWGCTQPQPATDRAETASHETNAAVARLLAPPQLTTGPGFHAEILVAPGQMYDPLTLIPHGDSVWVNDDGREAGERGGRIYQVDRSGRVSVVVDTDRLYPPTGFDIAPAGFGSFAGQIFTVSQPRSTSLGTRRNHVILRINPDSREAAQVVCTLPTHGEVEGGIPGGGLDARFGPANTSFAGKLYAVTIFNATVYQMTPDGACTPFVTLNGYRPFGIAFSANGTRMLVAAGAAVGAPVPFGVSPPAPTGAILAIGPNGVVDTIPIVEGVARPWGLAVAPGNIGQYAGEIFFTGAGPAQPVGSPTGSGALYRLHEGRPEVVASGFFSPTGVAFVGDEIWVADIKGDFIPGQQLPDGTIFKITRAER